MIIPLKLYVPTDRRPWVNYALMAVIIVTSLICFNDVELVCRLAGVDLDRKRLGGIEKLQKQGKPWLWIVSAQQRFAALGDELAQRGPGQGPELDDALVGPMV